MANTVVTLAVFFYNHERYVQEAIVGALSQTYQPLEIIFSDDCSTDQTFLIIQELAASYSGPHTVRVNRNARNLGFGEHVNAVAAMASGEWIALAGGDDISLSGRIETMAKLIERGQDGTKTFAAFSTALGISESGEEICPAPQLGASGFYHRSLFKQFTPFRASLRTEDLALLFRSNLIGDSVQLRQPLIKYRIHGQNTWAREVTSIDEKLGHACRQLRMMSSLFMQMITDLSSLDPDSHLREKKRLRQASWHARWQTRLIRKITNGEPTMSWKCVYSKRLNLVSKLLLLLFALPKSFLFQLLSFGSIPRVRRHLGGLTVGFDRPPLPQIYRSVVQVRRSDSGEDVI